MLINKKIKMPEAINYRVAQIIGALLGAILYWIIKGTTMSLLPGDGVALWRAGLVEVLFTFLLVMVVYMTAVYRKAENHSYRGLAIGLTVFVGAVSVGRISGGAFNTAVATGSILIDWMNNGIS
jgi:aquaporin Z